MSKVALTYRFTFPDSQERVFELEMDRDTAELTPAECVGAAGLDRAGLQSMHRLSAQCRRDAALSRRLAARWRDRWLHRHRSYDKVKVTVESEERDVVCDVGCTASARFADGLDHGVERLSAHRGVSSDGAFSSAVLERIGNGVSSRVDVSARSTLRGTRRCAGGFRAQRSRARISRRALGESRHGDALCALRAGRMRS